MLKEVQYGTEPHVGKVVYLINNSHCVFSGISGREALSTINAAEAIIKAIAAQEGVDLGTLTFFDLQTRAGYPTKLSGEYDLDQLEVAIDGANVEVRNWRPTSLPTTVKKLFTKYIS